MSNHTPKIRLLLLSLCMTLLHGCATLNTPRDPHDPWERFNRSMYGFNNALDRTIVKPVAKGYQAITPDPVETGVSNFFSNLGDITVIANDILQFKFLQALSDLGRFTVNSTIGLYGLFDVATHFGLPKHNEDFGQTLGRWKTPSGPYLVLPLFGPSSIRDGVGLAVDTLFDPVVQEIDDRNTRLGVYTLDLISTRAELLEASDIIDEAAYDPYIFLREAYIQRRRNLVHDGDPPFELLYEEVDIFADD